MEEQTRRAARFRSFLMLAIPALGVASLSSATTATDITFTPATLTFKYQIGTALPASQTLQVKSTGNPLTYTLATTGPAPYLGKWLNLSLNGGTTPGSIKVYVNPTGLAAGIYTGSVVITSAGAATSPQSVPVTLEVGDAAPTLTTNTTALTFSWVSGAALPASQPIVLMSSGAALSATIAVSGGSWLKASPSGSVSVIGLPTTVTATADPTGLAPGSYTAQIKFSSTTAANKSVSVGVTLNVTAGVPTITGVWPPGASINAPDTVVTLTGANYFSTSVAAIGATALKTVVLSPTAMQVTVPATMMTSAGPLSIVITTPTAASPSTAATFTVYPAGPQVWAVTNAASYAGGTVSPGGIITIYGLDLGPSTLALFAGTNPIATSLPSTGPATSVSIDGNAAPLLYTSATQVSCIVPYALTAKVGSAVNLVLTYNAVPSANFSVNVVAAEPGIFTLDSSGVGQGAILNYNATTGDYTVNGSSNAAVKGSIVVIYATGFGQTNPGGNETQLISGVVNPVGTVSVTIDGQAAAVQGAAAPVGSVPGLMQVNVTVPTAAQSGKAVPVIVSVGTAQSQANVTMAVK